jgi:hypothetical protein
MDAISLLACLIRGKVFIIGETTMTDTIGSVFLHFTIYHSWATMESCTGERERVGQRLA